MDSIGLDWIEVHATDFQWTTNLIIYDESFEIALSDGLLKCRELLRGYWSTIEQVSGRLIAFGSEHAKQIRKTDSQQLTTRQFSRRVN